MQPSTYANHYDVLLFNIAYSYRCGISNKYFSANSPIADNSIFSYTISPKKCSRFSVQAVIKYAPFHIHC